MLDGRPGLWPHAARRRRIDLTGGANGIIIVAMIRNKQPKRASKKAELAETAIFRLQADICQTLANPKRLQILNLLKGGELSVGEMVEALVIPKANLSQHLAVMRHKRILETRREGTTIFYSIALPRIIEACGIMRDVLMESLKGQEEISRSLRREVSVEGRLKGAGRRQK